MMNSTMEKILSVLCAAGAAVVVLIMIFFELINNDVPALVWLAFSVVMFANAAFYHLKGKRRF